SLPPVVNQYFGPTQSHWARSRFRQPPPIHLRPQEALAPPFIKFPIGFDPPNDNSGEDKWQHLPESELFVEGVHIKVLKPRSNNYHKKK
ncbi:unnamed protein product, partial [Allacma fusca]